MESQCRHEELTIKSLPRLFRINLECVCVWGERQEGCCFGRPLPDVAVFACEGGGSGSSFRGDPGYGNLREYSGCSSFRQLLVNVGWAYCIINCVSFTPSHLLSGRYTVT